MRLSSMVRSAPPIWVLVLLAVLLWGAEFVRRDLWEPDEARYAYVAREMRAGGHWFVPHINGEPYPDKPPLMFWLINASSLLTSGRINGISARLPSLLGSLMTLWVVTRLLARWHSTEAAWRAILVLLTTFLFWQEGGWGQIDALLCGLVMMSTYFLFASRDAHMRRRECLAYIFAGLAVLAKGPVGLVLPMGIFAVSMAASGKASDLKRWHWLWGPLVAVAIPAAWLSIAWLQDAPSEYFASMFGESSFGRVANPKSHSRPFHYFLWHFPLELLPWTVFAPAALKAFSDRILKRRFLGWIVFVIALFSLFAGKRNLYILSAYPAAAMLIAAAWDDMLRLPYRTKLATAIAGIGLLGILAIALIAVSFMPQLPFNRFIMFPSATVLILGGLILTRLFRRERLTARWLLTFCGVYFVFQVTAAAVILPGFNPVKAPRAAAKAVGALLAPNEPVYLYRQQLAIFPLYAERPGREIHTPQALETVIAEQTNAIVVMREPFWRDLDPRLKALGVAHQFRVGHKHQRWVQFSNER